MSFRWSFSQWETYNSCPAKWKYKYVSKLPSVPPGPAAARGLSMHDRCENYITGQIDVNTLLYGDPTKRFGNKTEAKIQELYLPVLDRFRDHENGDRHAELRLGFDDEWYACGFARTGWCIGVLDAVRFTNDGILEIGEWKSGSPKDTHGDQRKIYALFGLRRWNIDKLKEVRVTTYYLEHADVPPQRLVVAPTAEEKLKALWKGRVEQMQADQVLAPRPNEGCRWCDYAKSKGGPCAFGG